MKKTLKFAILPALLIGVASVAYADSIEIGSYGTFASNQGNANTSLVYWGYDATSGTPHSYTGGLFPFTTDISPLGAGWVTIPNSSWVSVANSGAGGVTLANGYYEYQSYFSALGGTYNGTISVLADDTASIWIDGQLVVGYATGGQTTCYASEPNCTVVDTINVSNLLLNSGFLTNTITVIDEQKWNGPAGVDFQGDLTQTPEPSSLLLMGSGLFGLAMIALRKAKATRLSVHS
jgi:hypothetical protein